MIILSALLVTGAAAHAASAPAAKIATAPGCLNPQLPQSRKVAPHFIDLLVFEDLAHLLAWFANDQLAGGCGGVGLRISWPTNGEYRQFAAYDLLRSVTAVLARHTRCTF